MLKQHLTKMTTSLNVNKGKRNRNSFLMIIEEKQKQQTYIDVLSKEMKPLAKILENVTLLAY